MTPEDAARDFDLRLTGLAQQVHELDARVSALRCWLREEVRYREAAHAAAVAGIVYAGTGDRRAYRRALDAYERASKRWQRLDALCLP